MKELLILSGKGGTGKTSLAASFIHMAESCLACDYDVDASNLHILLKPYESHSTEFSAGVGALLNKEICIDCGLCKELCRFEAISDAYDISSLSCEGCGFCYEICPAQAITLEGRSSGKWYASQAISGGHNIPFFHADLRPGEENSGKLVAQVKNAARKKSEEEGYSLLIADGPPGIGCPVISALVGVDLVAIVTEPSVSGFHDLKRVVELLNLRGVKAVVIINKADLNAQTADEIESWANKNNIPCAGRLPFSSAMADAVAAGEIPAARTELGSLIYPLWQNILEVLAPL